MTTIEEIQAAVRRLSSNELSQFRRWFLEQDGDAWDRQLARDVSAGKLDFLEDEAREECRSGKVRKL